MSQVAMIQTGLLVSSIKKELSSNNRCLVQDMYTSVDYDTIWGAHSALRAELFNARCTPGLDTITKNKLLEWSQFLDECFEDIRKVQGSMYLLSEEPDTYDSYRKQCIRLGIEPLDEFDWDRTREEQSSVSAQLDLK